MAQRDPPSAAQALYGHLPSAARVERPERKVSLADDLWPRPKPQPPNPYREILLKHLRELNAQLQREWEAALQKAKQRKLGEWPITQA